MTIEWYGERRLRGIPEMEIPREGNVVRVGRFPSWFGVRVLKTESGLWTLRMYQGSLVRRRWRPGDSLPKDPLEEPHEAEIESIRTGSRFMVRKPGAKEA